MNGKSAVVLAFAIALGIIAGVSVITLLSGQLGVAKFSIAQTTTSKDRFFEVNGTSEISTKPDRAEVSLGISVVQPTAKAAQEKANAVIAQITADLKKLNFKDADMKTENYSIYPNYNYGDRVNGSTPKINDYTALVSLRVRTEDFDKINDAIDSATKNGANTIGSISFTVSDTKQKELAKEGRKQAIEQAKKNAEELASLSGMRLGRVVDVKETQTGGIEPRGIMVMAAMKAVDTETNVQPGSSTLKYSVTLSYETQ